MLWSFKVSYCLHKQINSTLRDQSCPVASTALINHDCVLISTPAYLKHSEGKRVSQVVMGGQQHFAVVSVQIHAGQQVQLGVHPVQTPVGQVCEEIKRGKEKRKKERERRMERERSFREKRPGVRGV